MLERLPIPRLSGAGITVMHRLSVSGERPTVLLRAFESGAMPSSDLPELIAFAWTRDDSPTCGVSEAKWIEVFERAGFFTYPPIGTGRPSAPVTVYRRATAERAARMSWAAERNMAVQLSARHTRYGAAPGCTRRPCDRMRYWRTWSAAVRAGRSSSTRPGSPRPSAAKNCLPDDRGRKSP